MERSIELQIIDRVRALAESRSSDADDAITRLDVDRYRSEARYHEELRAFYRRRWTAVGHASEVSEAGSYFTARVAGESVVVVRGSDGEVRAFHNVCRHRGTRVAVGHGCTKSFVCPYHGWTYGLDGTLVGVPHAWGFEGLDKASSGLVPASAATSAGVVFVRLEGDAPLEHAALDEVRAFVPRDTVAFCRRERVVEAGWKIIVDGALEAYHIKRAHADTIYPMFIDNVGVVERLGNDLRVVMPKRTIRELDEVNRERWALREHSNIVYYLFPNALVLVLGDHAMLVMVEPETAARTRVHSMMLVPPGGTRDEYWRKNEQLFQTTLEEDYAVGESIQAGLASGKNAHVTLGRFEKGIRLFHAILDDAG